MKEYRDRAQVIGAGLEVVCENGEVASKSSEVVRKIGKWHVTPGNGQ